MSAMYAFYPVRWESPLMLPYTWKDDQELPRMLKRTASRREYAVTNSSSQDLPGGREHK